MWGLALAGAELLLGHKANKDNKDAAKKSEKRLAESEAAARELNERRYEEAKKTLSPYLTSSSIANRQLMIELGLGDQYAAEEQKGRTGNLAALQQQLADLQERQAGSVQSTAKMRTIAGGTLGKLVGKLAGEKESRDLKNFTESSADLQTQIAEVQAAIDSYAANPQAAQEAPGTAYMRTPVYQGAIQAGTDAVNAGAAEAGSLYSGARGIALKDVGQNVNQSMYNNYLNLLQNTASPATATNFSNMGIGQAGNIGQQNIAATQMRNAYNMQGAEDQGAYYADVAGGLSNAFTAYMNRPKTPKIGSPPPPLPMGATDSGSTTRTGAYA